ncbi:ferredoxin-thioredoxin reductase catalytic domain-containing protein [Candidatus Margulisiibacteriota bacterium]
MPLRRERCRVLNKQEILAAFEEFCQKNEFNLNFNKAHVEACIDGILENEKKYGLKYCPCRIAVGDFEKDVELLCPCNFKAQEKYRNQGECWCGLFKKGE